MLDRKCGIFLLGSWEFFTENSDVQKEGGGTVKIAWIKAKMNLEYDYGFLNILSIYLFLLCSMWDLSSLTRDWTCGPFSETAQS